MTHTQGPWFYGHLAGAIGRGGTPRVNYTGAWAAGISAVMIQPEKGAF